MRKIEVDADHIPLKTLLGGKVALLETNSLATEFVPEGGADERLETLNQTKAIMLQARAPVTPEVPRGICIETTFACNLRCKYCFVKQDERWKDNNTMMTYEMAKQFLSKYADAERKGGKCSINFMGGEPLLNMPLVADVVRYVKATYKTLTHFSVTTNGLRLGDKMERRPYWNDDFPTPTIAQYLDSHKFNITLSMDGPKEVQDSFRVKPDGSGSFDELMEALRSARKLAPNLLKNRTTFRATFSDVFDGGVSLKDRLEFFVNLSREGIGQGVHLEPATTVEGCGVTHNTMDEKLQKAFEEQYAEAARWTIDEIRAGRKVGWVDVRSMMILLRTKRPKTTSCGAGPGYMTLTAAGTIHACHRTEGALIGNMKTGVDESLSAK
jgi:uncharacterized protein